jgi:sugar O-acyltransferase (sialic acid O-acetyltransferase NeuD family)
MLIIGAKGFAKEVVEVVHQCNDSIDLAFYDDVNADIPLLLFGKFPVLKTVKEAIDYFKNTDKRFTIGIGNPVLRKKLYDKFSALGGIFTSTISKEASIGSFDVEIGVGCNILAGANFSNSTTVGKGSIIYYNSIITHDCKIGDFVEISPNVTVLGRVSINSYTQIGASATILPNLKIGMNVIVAAGSVVTKDVPDNCLVVGVPALIKKEIPRIQF